MVKPAMYRASSPKDAIDILLRRKRRSFSKLEEKASIFIKEVTEIFGALSIPSEANQFTLISEREAIYYKAEKAILDCQETLKDVTPFRELTPWLSILSNAVYDALKRGVNVRCITEKPQNSFESSKILQKFLKDSNFNVRFISNMPKAKFAIFDNKEVIMGLFCEHNFAESPALWSNNSDIVSITESYFETLEHWNRLKTKEN